MNLNLLYDVNISEITKNDNGIITYSYNGIDWYNSKQNVKPSFISKLPTITFTNSNSVSGYIVFEFSEPQSIFDINLDYTVGGSPIINYQYSIDGINYIEYEYFTCDTTNPLYTNTIFIKDIINNKYRYSIYGRYDNINSDEYSEILSIINSTTHRQVFTVSTTDILQYIYSERYIKFLKINFIQMDTTIKPFVLLNIDLLSKKVLTTLHNVYDISFITHHLYRQGYFRTYDFIPSMSKSFLTLLSNKESNV